MFTLNAKSAGASVTIVRRSKLLTRARILPMCSISRWMKLRDAGNTLVVIEHNLEMIKSADWIIDLGPEAGERGGEIVGTGPPEEIAEVSDSLTGKFLRPLMHQR